MLLQMGIYYVSHVHGVEVFFKKWNNLFKPRVINILAQISWSDASKSPRDKDKGEERCDEEGSGTVKSEAWGRGPPYGVLPPEALTKKVTEEGNWQMTAVKENLNKKCKTWTTNVYLSSFS